MNKPFKAVEIDEEGTELRVLGVFMAKTPEEVAKGVEQLFGLLNLRIYPVRIVRTGNPLNKITIYEKAMKEQLKQSLSKRGWKK